MATKILLIEDDEPLRKALVDKFRAEGFEVSEAVNGEEGLSLALRNRPDLVALNLILPKKDGLTVLRELRADSWGKSVPVIILTVMDADEGMIKEILAYKPAYYFIKSDWKIDDVVAKVKELLNSPSA